MDARQSANLLATTTGGPMTRPAVIKEWPLYMALPNAM